MSALVKIKVTRQGEATIERVRLLGGSIESTRRDEHFEDEISIRLPRIIKDSTVFMRLRREVMFALSSEYALMFHEMIQKHGNLRDRAPTVLARMAPPRPSAQAHRRASSTCKGKAGKVYDVEPPSALDIVAQPIRP